MTEISRIMELRGRLSSEADIKILDSAVSELGNAFKAMLLMTKQLMQGNAPDKLDMAGARNAVAALNELGAGRGYSLPEFRNDKELCDFVVKFGSELIK